MWSLDGLLGSHLDTGTATPPRPPAAHPVARLLVVDALSARPILSLQHVAVSVGSGSGGGGSLLVLGGQDLDRADGLALLSLPAEVRPRAYTQHARQQACGQCKHAAG